MDFLDKCIESFHHDIYSENFIFDQAFDYIYRILLVITAALEYSEEQPTSLFEITKNKIIRETKHNSIKLVGRFLYIPDAADAITHYVDKCGMYRLVTPVGTFVHRHFDIRPSHATAMSLNSDTALYEFFMYIAASMTQSSLIVRKIFVQKSGEVLYRFVGVDHQHSPNSHSFFVDEDNEFDTENSSYASTMSLFSVIRQNNDDKVKASFNNWLEKHPEYRTALSDKTPTTVLVSSDGMRRLNMLHSLHHCMVSNPLKAVKLMHHTDFYKWFVVRYLVVSHSMTKRTQFIMFSQSNLVFEEEDMAALMFMAYVFDDEYLLSTLNRQLFVQAKAFCLNGVFMDLCVHNKNMDPMYKLLSSNRLNFYYKTPTTVPTLYENIYFYESVRCMYLKEKAFKTNSPEDWRNVVANSNLIKQIPAYDITECLMPMVDILKQFPLFPLPIIFLVLDPSVRSKLAKFDTKLISPNSIGACRCFLQRKIFLYTKSSFAWNMVCDTVVCVTIYAMRKHIESIRKKTSDAEHLAGFLRYLLPTIRDFVQYEIDHKK